MVKIVSDSSSLYSIDGGQANGVIVSPIIVTINDKTYREYEDINTQEFIDIINEGHLPKSSQPSIGEVLDIYNSNEEDEIVNITLADGLSGTYNSACMAKQMADKPENITVINSKTLCGPQNYLVNLAVALRDAGKSKDEIVNEIEETLKVSKSFLMPHDFDYLVRGGRISSLAGKIGSAIHLVPVMALADDGKSLVKFATKRTFKKAIQSICDVMKENNVDADYKIYISHACKEELADIAKKIILSNIEDADIEEKLLGPAFTTQGGPGCVAIQYIKKHPILK